MRLATWNVNSVTARMQRLLDWLGRVRPDVVCLQETKVVQFPAAGVEQLGYRVAAYGLGRWNGVAILSRVGIDDIKAGFAGEPGFAQVEARAIAITCAGVRIWSVYVPNGRTPTDDHYSYKLSWLKALHNALAEEVTAHTDLVVCGDFNIAPTDADVWDPTAFVGATHVTEPEREALAALRSLGLHDVIPTPMKGSNPLPTGTIGQACSTKTRGCASTSSMPQRR